MQPKVFCIPDAGEMQLLRSPPIGSRYKAEKEDSRGKCSKSTAKQAKKTLPETKAAGETAQNCRLNPFVSKSD